MSQIFQQARSYKQRSTERCSEVLICPHKELHHTQRCRSVFDSSFTRWGLLSCVMWRRLDWQAGTNISRELAASIFMDFQRHQDLESYTLSIWYPLKETGQCPTHNATLNFHLHICNFRRVSKTAESKYQLRHVCLSVRPPTRPHGTTQLPLDGFSPNLIPEDCSKIWWKH
jgi:hypothetical protein